MSRNSRRHRGPGRPFAAAVSASPQEALVQVSRRHRENVEHVLLPLRLVLPGAATCDAANEAIIRESLCALVWWMLFHAATDGCGPHVCARDCVDSSDCTRDSGLSQSQHAKRVARVLKESEKNPPTTGQLWLRGHVILLRNVEYQGQIFKFFFAFFNRYHFILRVKYD